MHPGQVNTHISRGHVFDSDLFLCIEIHIQSSVDLGTRIK